MEGEIADGGRRGGIATGVGGLAAEDFFELRGEVGPRAHVLRFFLRPDESRGVAVSIGEFGEGVFVERVELL